MPCSRLTGVRGGPLAVGREVPRQAAGTLGGRGPAGRRRRLVRRCLRRSLIRRCLVLRCRLLRCLVRRGLGGVAGWAGLQVLLRLLGGLGPPEGRLAIPRWGLRRGPVGGLFALRFRLVRVPPRGWSPVVRHRYSSRDLAGRSRERVAAGAVERGEAARGPVLVTGPRAVVPRSAAVVLVAGLRLDVPAIDRQVETGDAVRASVGAHEGGAQAGRLQLEPAAHLESRRAVRRVVLELPG